MEMFKSDMTFMCRIRYEFKAFDCILYYKQNEVILPQLLFKFKNKTNFNFKILMKRR